MNLYAIAVERSDTGERDEWLWNQAAPDEATALVLSDAHLRALGWPAAWRSVEARLLDTAVAR